MLIGLLIWLSCIVIAAIWHDGSAEDVGLWASSRSSLDRSRR